MMMFWGKKKREEDPFEKIVERMFENFPDLRRIQEEMDEMMKESFTEEDFPKIEELMKRMKPGKPMVYGFSFRMGPEGKPIIEEFGNIEPREKEIKEEREPLVDVINKEKEVTVLAELPGVEKHEIKIKIGEGRQTLIIDVPAKFFKKVKLPAKVLPKLGKASYKNGVLEVNMTKEKAEEPKVKGTEIPVE
jgi:HSP20 family protein